MGGYIAVESKPGHGTTMHVNLPPALGRELDMPAESMQGVIAKPFTLQELNQALNLAMVRSTRTVH
jgi:hypothetical protein